MGKTDFRLMHVELPTGRDRDASYTLTFQVTAQKIKGDLVVSVPFRARASRSAHKRIEDLELEGRSALRAAGLPA
jgi:hypothetical protein